jgi:flagellar hook-length control protein FliK
LDIKLPIITQPLATPPLKGALPVSPVAKVAPVVEVAPKNPNQAENQRQWLNATLRQLLPQQISPTRLLTQLLHDLPTFQQNDQLPANLKTLLQSLIQALPPALTLNNPQLLAQALQNSGLFLEAKLAQRLSGTSQQLQQDFKANLLKLKAALQQHELESNNIEALSAEALTALTALHQNTVGALSKLLVDQLASLSKENSPKQVWFVEIPFLTQNRSDSLKLEVERDATHATEPGQAPCWSVTLTLTPPRLGTLYCKISFIENTLNAYFRSEDAQTLGMIEQHTAQLRTQFEAVGLTPGYIDVQKGQLEKSLTHKLHSQTLFDDKA